MRALLTVLVSAVLLLPGLGGAAVAGPDHHRPSVGSCHDYGHGQLRKRIEPSRAVPCSARHTARTVAVLGFDGPRDNASIRKAVVGCGRALVGLLGDPTATAYTYGFFFPTRAEVAKGARWVRCDVVLEAGGSLAPLADPLVTDPGDDRVARCAVQRPNDDTATTTCASPHDFRTIATVKLDARGGYPGSRQLSGQVLSRCSTATSEPLDFYVFPSALEWRAGYRSAACETRSST